MNLNTIDRLNALLDAETGYKFDFGAYFNRGVEIWAKWWWAFSGYAALFFVMTLAIRLVPVLGLFADFAVSAALYVGFYLVAHNISRNKYHDFGQFFGGFQHFGKLMLVRFVVYLLVGVLGIIGIVALQATTSGFEFLRSRIVEAFWDMESFQQLVEPVAYVLIVITAAIGTYFGVAWQLAPLLVVFEGAGVLESLKWSRKIVNRHWFMFLLITVVLLVGAALGVLALGLGFFVTWSAAQVIQYAMYDSIVGNSEEDEFAIEDHLIPEDSGY